MGHKLQKLTTAASAALVLAALLACKKKKDEAPPPVASAVASAPAPVASASAAPTPPKDEVKRYGDKEKEEKGTVRVSVANTKVYKEADATTDYTTTLAKGTFVNKKASYGNWLLVDYPSGVGELSPGWILARMVSTQVVTIDPAELKKQQEEAAQKAADDAKKAADEAAAKAAAAKDAGATAVAAAGDAGAAAQKAIDDAKKAADDAQKAAAAATATTKPTTIARPLGLPNIKLRVPAAPKKP